VTFDDLVSADAATARSRRDTGELLAFADQLDVIAGGVAAEPVEEPVDPRAARRHPHHRAARRFAAVSAAPCSRTSTATLPA
jgi:hypothetical protein